MGSTKAQQDAQQNTAPKVPREKIIVGTVSPGKPYYSSKELREGFERTFPAATQAEKSILRGRVSPGELSPREALFQLQDAEAPTDVVTEGADPFRGKKGLEEEKRGARIAREAAKMIAKKTRVF